MSAFLAGLYLSAGLAGVASTPPAEPIYQFWRWDLTEVHNPYGILEAGWSTPPDRQWSVSVSLRHMSSVHVNDYGINSLEARLTWRPYE
jgi:hypothetical protein